jgi:hypothetical protein
MMATGISVIIHEDLMHRQALVEKFSIKYVHTVPNWNSLHTITDMYLMRI